MARCCIRAFSGAGGGRSSSGGSNTSCTTSTDFEVPGLALWLAAAPPGLATVPLLGLLVRAGTAGGFVRGGTDGEGAAVAGNE